MASATLADNLQVMQQERQPADTSDSDAVSGRPALGPARAEIARERWSDVNKNKYKSRGASDVKKISNDHLEVRNLLSLTINVTF